MHFLSFIDTETVQAVETFSRVRQGSVNPTYIVNTVVADGLATQGARASDTMVLTISSGIFRLQHQRG